MYKKELRIVQAVCNRCLKGNAVFTTVQLQCNERFESTLQRALYERFVVLEFAWPDPTVSVVTKPNVRYTVCYIKVHLCCISLFCSMLQVFTREKRQQARTKHAGQHQWWEISPHADLFTWQVLILFDFVAACSCGCMSTWWIDSASVSLCLLGYTSCIATKFILVFMCCFLLFLF